MSQTKSDPATKQIHISPDTYKTLRHLAVDRDSRLMEVAEEIIAEGLKVVRRRHVEQSLAAG